MTLVYFSDGKPTLSPEPDEEMREVCVPNISPQERKKRERFAIWQFVITLLALGMLVITDVNPIWRLLLFFMFSAATTSYFQSLDKT